MARRIRYLPEGSLVEVTCRTFQGRFLLRPSPRVNEIIVGVLARAKERYPVAIHAMVFMSNHYHLLVSPCDARRLSEFMRYVNTNLSKEIGRLHNWRGSVFERRYQAVLVSGEPAAQIARLEYILSHGSKEDLVASPKQWPGVHCLQALDTGEPLRGLWFDRTREYSARVAGRKFDPLEFAEAHELRLDPLPCWAHLPHEVYSRRIAEVVERIEQGAEQRRRAEQVQPGCIRTILKQHPHHRPSKLRWSPCPLVHAASRRVRKEVRQAYGEFLDAFMRAAEKLIAGDRSVDFPEGSFPPRLPFVECRVSI